MSTDNVQDKIYQAIADFATAHSNVQSKIILSKRDYNMLLKEARSTILGRAFTSNGFFFCTLPVYKYNGDEVVIA